MTWQFEVLGPLVARRGGVPVAVGGAAATVLAALLTEPGRLVSMADVIDRMWGDRPPSGPEKAVQSYVSRLRAALGDGSDIVVTRRPGYMLDIEQDCVDAVRFERMVRQGQRAMAAGAHAAAVRRLRQADDLWRAEAYQEFADAPFAVRERARLGELRLAAREAAIEAALDGGSAEDLIGELEALVSRHPLRERFWVHLVTALYRAGRQADALAAYRRARAALVEEAGLEPSVGLRGVERAVLTQDPRLDAVVSDAIPAVLASLAGPAFIGRDAELGDVLTALDEAAYGRAQARLISGGSGSGKTRFAAELAVLAARSGAQIRYLSAGWDPGTLAGDRYRLIVLDDMHRAAMSDLDQAARQWRDATAKPAVLLVLADMTAAPPHLLQFTQDMPAVMLRPLHGAALTSLVQLYLGDRAADQNEIEEFAARVDGVPARVHQAAAQWAKDRASARISRAVAAIESPRRGVAVAHDEIVAGVLDLERARTQRRPAGSARPPACPYKGLARYESVDAQNFQGRGQVTAELVARLVGHEPLVVIGASGCGKSSVVRAGLLPALADAALPGSAGWRHIIAMPGRTPAGALASLIDAGTVLLIDQFEEVFTVLGDIERAAYLALIEDARRREATVVLTLRSGYVAKAVEHPMLAQLVSANACYVSDMGVQELRAAIEGPAHAAGLELEPGLIEDLLADMGQEPGRLPLLSTALLSLWQNRDGHRLTRHAYAHSGRISGAVERLGERAYARLTAAEQQSAQRMLLRLADVDDGGQYIRRAVSMTDLLAIGGDRAATALDHLIEHRLLTADLDVVQVAHEALLRHWPRLRAWLDDDATGRTLRRHLIPAAREWAGRGRDAADLYRGARLAVAMDWAAERGVELTLAEREFLDAGQAAAIADTLRTRRANRRLRILAAAVAVAMSVASVGAAVAVRQRNQEATQRDRADSASRIADARRLAAQSLTERNLRLAMLEAVAATKLDPSPVAAFDVLAALQRAPQLQSAGGAEDTDRQLALAVSPDGSTVVAGSRQARIRVFAAGTLTELHSFTDPDLNRIWGIQFLPGGSRIAVWSSDRIVVFDVRTGQRTAAPFGQTIGISGGLLPDGRSLVTGDPQAPASIYDIASSRKTRTLAPAGTWDRIDPDEHTHRVLLSGREGVGLLDSARGTPRLLVTGAVRTAALSPDGRTLLVVRPQTPTAIEVWDLQRHQLRGTAIRHTSRIWDLAWAADGTRFVSSGDELAVVWDSTTLEPAQSLLGHSGRILNAAFSPDGDHVYTAALDGAVFAWDVRGDGYGGTVVLSPGWHGSQGCELGPSTVLSVAGRFVQACTTVKVLDPATGRIEGPVLDIGTRDFFSFSMDPAGRWLAVGLLDGRLQLWDPHDGRKLLDRAAVEPGMQANTVAVSDDGTMVGAALITPQETASRLYIANAHTGQLIGEPWAPDTPVSQVQFSPDGRHLVIGGYDGTLTVLSIPDLHQVARIKVALAGFAIFGLMFSPDGRQLAIGGGAGLPMLVDATTWRPVWQATTGHGGMSLSITFAPDGRTLMSAGADGRLLVYDRQTGGLLTAIGPKTDQWTYAIYTADGKHVAATGEDGSIRVYDLDPASWITHACAIAHRDMTEQEWRQLLPERAYQHVCSAAPA